MTSKIIFNVTPEHYNILLLENGSIVEFHQEEKSKTYNVGDIYLGTVKRIDPTLNAAFVDIGQKKDAFLHYSDLSFHIRDFQKYLKQPPSKFIASLKEIELGEPVPKQGQMKNVFKEKDKIMVQVTKEAISTKGTRLSAMVSLAGRYLILVPFSNEVTISKKITKTTERKRLLRLIEAIRPHNFGIVVRTVAQGKQVAELVADLDALKEKWSKGIQTLSTTKKPLCLIKEANATQSILRDILNENFGELLVDDVTTYEEVRQYIQTISPEKLDIIHLYQGKKGLFKYLGVEQTLYNLFGEIVGLEGGGHIVIEQTEAMHVIDVNTGNRAAASSQQEDIFLGVNLAAAKEIARQLRLRDIGGIICVDFVGMSQPQHKKQIYQAMQEAIKADRAKIEVSPLSKRGVMEITRARVRPATRIENREKCPNCQGTGKVQPPVLIAQQLEEQIALLLGKQKIGGMTLEVNPFLYAYLQKGWLSKRWQWFWKYWKMISITTKETLPLTTYKIYDRNNRLIATNPRLERRKTPLNRYSSSSSSAASPPPSSR